MLVVGLTVFWLADLLASGLVELAGLLMVLNWPCSNFSFLIFRFFFSVRIGVDAAANGLHPSFQNDIFDAELCVDTDEIKPSQVSVSCD